VRTDLLEAAVWEDVRALLAEPDRVRAEYERRVSGNGPDEVSGEQLRARLQKAKRVVARLIDAYEEGLLEKAEFEPRLGRARQQLAALEGEAQAAAERAAQEETVEAVVGQLHEFARRVTEGLEEASWATKRAILRALIKRVEVDAEEVRVVDKVDPRPFADGPEGGRLQDRLGRDLAAAGQHRPARAGGAHP
jgi:site-specific DNA recombinase